MSRVLSALIAPCLGSTFVLGGGGVSVAIVHMGLYNSDSGWGWDVYSVNVYP